MAPPTTTSSGPEPLSTKDKAFFLSLIVVLIAFIPWVIDFTVSKSYPTRRGGALLITGASTGLGHDAAVLLVDEGYTVYAGVRKPQDATALKALGKGDKLIPVTLDVTSPRDIDKVYERIAADLKQSGKPFAALVNNAGYANHLPIEFENIKSIKEVFDTNVVGAVALTQKFLPLIRKDQGRIIMVTSFLGQVASPLFGTLSATKFALEAYAASLRRELAPYKVSVSTIQPGIVATPALTKSVGKEDPPEVKDVYGHLYAPAQQAKMKRGVSLASGTGSITHAYVSAVASTHPRTKYPVGNVGGIPTSVLLSLTSLLPDRLVDALLS